MKQKLLIIAGPTAVGKTAISIKLAKKLNGEIISCDSMQIYKGMDIGSAKIKEQEMQGIKHYMLDIISPDENYTVAQYKEEVENLIEEISSRGKLPIITGGTGLYINSIICSMNFSESDKDEDYRNYLESLANENGNEYIHDMLKECDKASYDNIHYNNRKRVIRALEVYKLTGKPFSSYSSGEDYYTCNYDLYYYVLNMNRETLYKRINKRVDIMLDEGLIDEVKHLKECGYDSAMQSMQGIGYKEVLDYLDGRMTLDESVEAIKKGSRNYAKRQLTWFRKDPRAEFIYKDQYGSEEDIINYIVSNVK